MVKNLPANAGDAGSIPGLGRSAGEENSQPTPVFYLKVPMDRGAWWAPGGLKRSQKSWTGLATEQQRQIWTSQKNRLHTVIVI